MSKIIKFIKSTIIETDILLLLLCIGASVFGIIMVHSATTLRITEDALVSRDTRTMIIAVAAGVFMAVAISFFDHKFITKMFFSNNIIKNNIIFIFNSNFKIITFRINI